MGDTRVSLSITEQIVQPPNLVATERARLHVRAQCRRLGFLERAEHVGATVLAELLVLVHEATTTPAPSSVRRIFSIPSRMRPLIVPTGASSIAAISVCV